MTTDSHLVATKEPTNSDAADATHQERHTQGASHPGGQAANTNSWRHGLRSRLRTSRLPNACRSIGNDADALRIDLEAAVLEICGTVSKPQRSIIRTCVDAEIVRRLLWRRYRIEADKLDVAAEVALTGKILAANEARDRAIEKLKLDRDQTTTLIQALYSRPADNAQQAPGTIAATGDVQPVATAWNATEAAT